MNGGSFRNFKDFRNLKKIVDITSLIPWKISEMKEGKNKYTVQKRIQKLQQTHQTQKDPNFKELEGI